MVIGTVHGNRNCCVIIRLVLNTNAFIKFPIYMQNNRNALFQLNEMHFVCMLALTLLIEREMDELSSSVQERDLLL